MKTISTVFLIFFSFYHLLCATATAVAPPSESESPSCSDELVKFSVCLPFISSSPNNLTDTPPIQCCDDHEFFSSASSFVCLCYLIHEPLILGFPINSSRLFSLPSLCSPSTTNISFKPNNISLESLCSGSPVLPPLHTITGLEIGRPKSNNPEQQSQVENDDYIAAEPTADSPSEEEEPIVDDYPTISSSSSIMLLMIKIRCGWLSLSVIFLLISYAISLS